MPKLISKAEALGSLYAKEYDSCWVCNLVKSHPYVLWEDDHCVVILSEYPRFWGHSMVLLKRHVLNYSDVSEEEEKSLSSNGFKIARKLESKLNPIRCFIAGLGTERIDVPHSSPHLHLNVIPVFKESARPSEIFTWENGIYQGSKEEWEQLASELRP